MKIFGLILVILGGASVLGILGHGITTGNFSNRLFAPLGFTAVIVGRFIIKTYSHEEKS